MNLEELNTILLEAIEEVDYAAVDLRRGCLRPRTKPMPDDRELVVLLWFTVSGELNGEDFRIPLHEDRQALKNAMISAIERRLAEWRPRK